MMLSYRDKKKSILYILISYRDTKKLKNIPQIVKNSKKSEKLQLFWNAPKCDTFQAGTICGMNIQRSNKTFYNSENFNIRLLKMCDSYNNMTQSQ